MQRNCLAYWIPEQIEAALERGKLAHAGSGQFKRISVTDRVWIIGRTKLSNVLYTVGFIDVDLKLETEAAQLEMYRRVPGYDIWDAAWHVFPSEGKECATRLVSLEPIYRKISFESKDHWKLLMDEEHPNAQALQTVRQLTPRAAGAIAEIWSAGT